MIHFIAENIIREYAVQTVDAFFRKISKLDIFRIYHEMNMWVVRSVMECCIPFHFRDWYLMSLGNLHSISTDKFSLMLYNKT